MKAGAQSKISLVSQIRYLLSTEKDKSKKQLNIYTKRMFARHYLFVFLLCLFCEAAVITLTHANCSLLFISLLVLFTAFATFCIVLLNFGPIFTIISELMNNPLQDQEIASDVIAGYIKKVNSYQNNISTAIKNISADIQVSLFLDLIKKKPLTEEYVQNTLNSISCRFRKTGLFIVYAFQCLSFEMQIDLKQRILFESGFFDVVSFVILPDELHLALVLQFRDEDLSEIDALKRTSNIEKTVLKGLSEEFSGMRFSRGSLCRSIMDIGFVYEQAIDVLNGETKPDEFNLLDKQVDLMVLWYMEGSFPEGDALKNKILSNIEDCSQAMHIVKLMLKELKKYEKFEFNYDLEEINEKILNSENESAQSKLKHIVEAFLADIKIYVDKHNNPIILKAKRMITEHYADSNLTQANMAEQLGVSSAYFSRLFSSTMGVTYLRYLNRFRVSLSLNLLRNTDMTVEDISVKCGFPSTRSYISAFKTEYGITPTAWRKNRLVCN